MPVCLASSTAGTWVPPLCRVMIIARDFRRGIYLSKLWVAIFSLLLMYHQPINVHKAYKTSNSLPLSFFWFQAGGIKWCPIRCVTACMRPTEPSGGLVWISGVLSLTPQIKAAHTSTQHTPLFTLLECGASQPAKVPARPSFSPDSGIWRMPYLLFNVSQEFDGCLIFLLGFFNSTGIWWVPCLVPQSYSLSFKSGSAIRTGSLASSKVIWWWLVVLLDAAAPAKVNLL